MGFIFSLVSGLCSLLFAVIIFITLKLIIRPNLVRKHFQKYPNVWTNHSPSLLAGDWPLFNQRYISKGTSFLDVWGDAFLENPRNDFVFTSVALFTRLFPSSPEAINETLKVIPNQVDRGIGIKDVARVFPTSIFWHQSNQNWKCKREAIGRAIQFNKASQYKQLMLETVRERASSWSSRGPIEFMKEATHLTFDVITKIIFGRDIDLGTTVPYRNMDGSFSELSLRDMFM